MCLCVSVCVSLCVCVRSYTQSGTCRSAHCPLITFLYFSYTLTLDHNHTLCSNDRQHIEPPCVCVSPSPVAGRPPASCPHTRGQPPCVLLVFICVHTQEGFTGERLRRAKWGQRSRKPDLNPQNVPYFETWSLCVITPRFQTDALFSFLISVFVSSC